MEEPAGVVQPVATAAARQSATARRVSRATSIVRQGCHATRSVTSVRAGKEPPVNLLLMVGLLAQVLGLAAVAVVVCVVLFLTGAIRPGRARRMQGGVERLSKKGEEKSDRTAGPIGEATESSLRVARKAADKSAEKGRQAHDKLTS